MYQRHDHHIHHAINYKKKINVLKNSQHGLYWWQLTLIGIGSIIGAGFFLGIGISISHAGPTVILGYLLGGIIAGIVFSALAEMSLHNPMEGSFRVYAENAFGPRMGFVSGWLYWIAGILIMAAEVTALAVFTRFWFPALPLWLLSLGFLMLGLGINLMGAQNFGRIESVFGIIKISTLAIFILFGTALIFGVLPDIRLSPLSVFSHWNWAATGPIGLWSAMILVLFSYGGIAVVSIASGELQNKKDTPKAGIALIMTLTLLYCLSLYFVLSMVPWDKIGTQASPFVTALSGFKIPYLNSIMNTVIISAAFSTMTGALYGVANILHSLSIDNMAPLFFKKPDSRGVYSSTLIASALGVGIFILISYLMPKGVYEYLSSAAGVSLIINWIIILASQISLGEKLDRKKLTFALPGFPYTSYTGILLIILVLAGTLFHREQRIGLLISLGLLISVFATYKFIFGKLPSKP